MSSIFFFLIILAVAAIIGFGLGFLHRSIKSRKRRERRKGRRYRR